MVPANTPASVEVGASSRMVPFSTSVPRPALAVATVCAVVPPRPAVPVEVEQYARWQRRRLRMRPGLTCLWAISGRDNVDFETWMKMDMQYIDNWSLALDWKIMLQTIPRVLTGHGAH